MFFTLDVLEVLGISTLEVSVFGVVVIEDGMMVERLLSFFLQQFGQDQATELLFSKQSEFDLVIPTQM